MNLQNRRIPDDDFRKERMEVLAQWPTGKDVDIDEAVRYHDSIPESKIFSKKLLAAKNSGTTLIQPRAGVPVLEEHITLLQYLQDKGEADLLPTTIDSYTKPTTPDSEEPVFLGYSLHSVPSLGSISPSGAYGLSLVCEGGEGQKLKEQGEHDQGGRESSGLVTHEMPPCIL